MNNEFSNQRSSIFCPECRSVISIGEIQKEKKVSLKFVFCPHCGKKIDFTDYLLEKTGTLESTYQFVNIRDLDHALEVIDNDTKFSHVFKKMLHHIITRIIYIEIRKLEDEKSKSINQMGLSSELIDIIKSRLKPISYEKPNLVLLRNLDKIPRKKFLSLLKKYQKRLRKNENYRKVFSIYQKWLIEMVYRIMCQLNTDEGLLAPEITIKEDLIQIFGLDKSLSDWGVEESFQIIDFCYRTYKDHNYNLKDILDNKNNVIRVIFSALQLKNTEFIQKNFYNIVRIVFYLMDFENGITTKRDLIKKTESSKRMVYRVIKRLENEFQVDFSTRFHKRGMNNKREEIMEKIRGQANDNSIRVISSDEDYINSDSELSFECLNCGVEFTDTWRNTMSRKSGLKCFYCDPNINPQDKEYYENRLKDIIESKAGKLLSEYLNSQTKVHIRCRQGHEWWATPQDIVQGTWCNECYYNNFREKSREEIEKIIQKKNGKLLDIDFSVKKTRVYVECENKHKWWTRRDAIIEGKWCKECYLNQIYGSKQKKEILKKEKRDKKLSKSENVNSEVKVDKKIYNKEEENEENNFLKKKYQILNDLINSKGGKLLSKEYLNSRTKVHVECEEGHRWWVTPDNLMNGGTWCPECHFSDLSEKFTEYSLSDLRDFAKSKGGDCLENNYLGWGAKHKWICLKNHIWTATPRNVFGRPAKKGTWCPYCADEEIFERVCRGILEELLDIPFPKSSPNWLNEDKIGKPGGRRHLDGYNEENRIAFECHGIQHYIYEPFFHNGDKNNFYYQQNRDKFVREKCKENNVFLIEIGFIKDKKQLRRLKFSEIEGYLIEKLEKNKIKIVKKNKRINWIKFISIHRKQDLILKLLILKNQLSISEIASYLKFGIKSTKIHLKALKSLDLVKFRTGKQNKIIYSVNNRLRDLILERTQHITNKVIEERINKIRPKEKKIIELLQKENYLTAKQISVVLKLSKRTTNNYIKSLEISGLITYKRKKGPGKSHPKLWYLNNS